MEDDMENRSSLRWKHMKHFSEGDSSFLQKFAISSGSLKRSCSYNDIPRKPYTNIAGKVKYNLENRKSDTEAKSCKRSSLIFIKSIQRNKLSSSTWKLTIFALMSILILSNVDQDDYTHPKFEVCEENDCRRKTMQEAVTVSIFDMSLKSSTVDFAQTDICVYPVSLACYFEHMANGSCNNSDDFMSNEMLRLYSFRNFLRNINISLIHLARSGFYHTDKPGETRCYSCRVTYRSWTSRDNPMNVHRRISPTCELVVQNQCRRTNDSPSTAYERLSIAPSNDIASNHLLSSTRGPSEISRPCDHGNHFLPSASRIQCQPVTQEVNSNDQSPSSREAEGGSSQINRVTNTDDTCMTSGDSEVDIANDSLPIVVQTIPARFPNYSSLQVRISSFQGWPGYLNQTAREMALAGFLYAGSNNYTRCFFCGGGLRNWEAGDDPWVEHARWFPQCGYVRQNKGERFINAVLKKQKETEASNNNTNTLQDKPQSMVASGSSVTSTTNDQSRHDVLHTVAAISVLEMGYTDQQVLEAFEILESLSSGSFHWSRVTAMDILNVLLNEDKKQSSTLASNRETSGNELCEMATSVNIDTELILEENRQLKDQRLCKVCLELNATIAFLPCGHITCCADCAPAMRKCPICRAYIKGTVKTYMA